MQMERFGQGAKLAGIALGQSFVDQHFAGRARGMNRDAHGQSPARHAAVDFVAQLGLKHLQFTGQIGRDFGLLAVDRADLDRHFDSALRALTPSVTGH